LHWPHCIMFSRMYSMNRSDACLCASGWVTASWGFYKGASISSGQRASQT
jgi:hypothetical protein